MTTTKIRTRGRNELVVETARLPGRTALQITARLSLPCVLHWGVSDEVGGAWQRPDDALWKGATGLSRRKKEAVQTPFAKKPPSGRSAVHFDWQRPPGAFVFALYFPEEDRWDNNRGKNYWIEIEQAAPNLGGTLERLTRDDEIVTERVFTIGRKERLAARTIKRGEDLCVLIVTNVKEPLFHWGVGWQRSLDWELPPPSMRPARSTVWSDDAVRTPFLAQQEGLFALELTISGDAPAYLSFVLFQEAPERWTSHRGGNFVLPVRPQVVKETADLASPLVATIIDNEMGPRSWTLMHRFNLCHELLEQTPKGDLNELALLFVWLRYSALRQLDWQRNYNTQPRELAHAMDRLTRLIARRYSEVEVRERSVPSPFPSEAERVGAERGERPLLRLMLSTLGHGSEGQRVRDEILQIMHRHRIKEISGSFLEEWHQKLHNNNTPDDLAICEGYLAFLRSDGDLDSFYRALESRGVNRERLKSYDRPIHTHPDFIPQLQSALIGEFDNFRRILAAVHEGTDLETAINKAEQHLDDEMKGRLSFIRHHRSALVPVMGAISKVRRRLDDRIPHEDDGRARDLLFLDLALADTLRLVVESHLDAKQSNRDAAFLLKTLLMNICLTEEDVELQHCAAEWRLLAGRPGGRDAARRALAAVERTSRALASYADELGQRVQPIADALGRSFEAESWTVELFSEEVVRGGLAFAASLVLRKQDPRLRAAAGVGRWRIASRFDAAGTVEVARKLVEVQPSSGSRILLVSTVTGDEEIPLGVTAVITMSTVDVLAHAAVRARNAGVFLATCFDLEAFEQLCTRAGETLRVTWDQRGEVALEEGETQLVQKSKRAAIKPLQDPGWKRVAELVLPRAEFVPGAVGRKALSIAHLAQRLPKELQIPRSVAIPFGVFEQVSAGNAEIMAAKKEMDLERLRELITALEVPREVAQPILRALSEARFDVDPAAGLTAMKRVWASAFNDRAVQSREANGIPHEQAVMSVLVQEAIAADYSFIIHTTNPVSDDPDELYAEVVVGLGESLASNHPGNALGFVYDRKTEVIRVLTYPSKSYAFFGGGVIFRSDCRAEDLPGYAGAGLYDSYLVPTARTASVDYTKERLVNDEPMLRTIAQAGQTVERVFESPQDIEGVIADGQIYIVQSRPQVGL